MGIRSIHLLLVSAIAAAFLFSTTSAMTYRSENSYPLFTLGDDDESECKKEIKKRCGDEIDDFKKELKDTSILGIIQAAASLAECLVSNIDHIAKKCLHFDVQPNDADIDYVFSVVVAENAVAKKSEPKCKDSVKKFCGEELDDLEDAIDDFDSPKKMIKAAKDFISCLVSHRDDIKDDCDDDMKAVALVQSEEESKCHKAVYKKCGDEIHKLRDAVDEISIFGIVKYAFKTVSCLTENLSDIIDACKSEKNTQSSTYTKSIYAAASVPSGLRNFIGSDDEKGKCHHSLYELCGDEISALKKAIHNTSPNGIIGSSLELSGCITSNFVKLIKECSPFEKNLLSDTSIEIDNIHFDFHDCVEMAKVQIKAETYGHDAQHPHGFMAAFIVFALLSAFFKGFLVGKGVDFCRKRFFPMRDAHIEPTNDVYSKMKDSSATPLA